ncbi:TonB-dependent receptor plug domain-containing protein [Vandammella animalimorsus]|nr:TonB-dependent receptor plug domain-containing protein [Vandammella animalimorsus]
MNSYTPVAAACLACAMLGWASAAQAQMPAASQPGPSHQAAEATVLAPVTVTAKGYEAQAVETPAALTVLTAEELARQQAHNLGEALRGQAGLAVSGDSAQGLNPVIRGLKKDSVVLLVDGMRLNSAQPAGAVASFMSLGLAEQVEVLKGPASVLYGTGALGGAINVRLPQARFAEPGQPALSGRARLGLDSASRGTEAMALLNASGGDHALMLGAALLHRGDRACLSC